MSKQFLLGYLNSDSETLTEFKSEVEADFKAEEWCRVEADTIEEATKRYEETFTRLKKDGKIAGPL